MGDRRMANEQDINDRGEFRMTRQRRLILQEVQASRAHPSADEVYRLVRRKMPRISLGTVYRNLDVLSQCGLIRRLEMSEGQRRFDGTMASHYHVRCTTCERVGDVWLDPPSELHQAEGGAGGYQISGHRLEFFGLCPICRDGKAPRGKG